MRCVTYLFVSVYRPVTTVSHDCTVLYEVFVQSNQFVLAFIYFLSIYTFFGLFVKKNASQINTASKHFF